MTNDPEPPIRFISTPLGRFIVVDDALANELPDDGTPLSPPMTEEQPGDKPPGLPLRERIQQKLRRHDPHRAELQRELQQVRTEAEAELHRSFEELRRHYANRASILSVSPVDPAPTVEPESNQPQTHEEN